MRKSRHVPCPKTCPESCPNCPPQSLPAAAVVSLADARSTVPFLRHPLEPARPTAAAEPVRLPADLRPLVRCATAGGWGSAPVSGPQGPRSTPLPCQATDAAGRPPRSGRSARVLRRSRPSTALGPLGAGRSRAGTGADARAARPAPVPLVFVSYRRIHPFPRGRFRPPYHLVFVPYLKVSPVSVGGFPPHLSPLVAASRPQSPHPSSRDSFGLDGPPRDGSLRGSPGELAKLVEPRRKAQPGQFFHTPVAQGAPHPVPALNHHERTPLAVERGQQRPLTQTKGDNSTATLPPGSTMRPGPRVATVPCLLLVKEIPSEQQLLTVQQVAGSLAICRRTLEREIQRGRFPRPVKIGAASRWPLADVQSYVAALTRSRPSSTPAP